MGESLYAPTILRGDRAAKVANLELGAGRLGLQEEVREAAAGPDLLGIDQRVILIGGMTEDGGAKRQGGEKQSHGGMGLDGENASGFQPIGGFRRKNESPPSFRDRGS